MLPKRPKSLGETRYLVTIYPLELNFIFYFYIIRTGFPSQILTNQRLFKQCTKCCKLGKKLGCSRTTLGYHVDSGMRKYPNEMPDRVWLRCRQS